MSFMNKNQQEQEFNELLMARYNEKLAAFYQEVQSTHKDQPIINTSQKDWIFESKTCEPLL